MVPTLFWLGEKEGPPPPKFPGIQMLWLRACLESPHRTSVMALPFNRWVAVGKWQPC